MRLNKKIAALALSAAVAVGGGVAGGLVATSGSHHPADVPQQPGTSRQVDVERAPAPKQEAPKQEAPAPKTPTKQEAPAPKQKAPEQNSASHYDAIARQGEEAVMNHANDGTHSQAEIQKHAEAYAKRNPSSQTARDVQYMKKGSGSTPSKQQTSTQEEQDRLVYNDKGDVVYKRTPSQQRSHERWINDQIEWAQQNGYGP